MEVFLEESPEAGQAILPCLCLRHHGPTSLKMAGVFIFCLISFVTSDHLTMNVVAKVGMGHHKDRDVSQAVQKMDNLVKL